MISCLLTARGVSNLGKKERKFNDKIRYPCTRCIISACSWISVLREAHYGKRFGSILRVVFKRLSDQLTKRRRETRMQNFIERTRVSGPVYINPFRSAMHCNVHYLSRLYARIRQFELQHALRFIHKIRNSFARQLPLIAPFRIYILIYKLTFQ